MESIKQCEHGLTDVCLCIECEICESKFHRQSISTVSLPNRNAFLACTLCGLQEQVSYWRLAFEKSNDNENELKATLNLYRGVMYRPETMEKMEVESSAPSFMERMEGWEVLSLETTLFFLEQYGKATEKLAYFAGKKSTPEERKKYLETKTKEAFEKGQSSKLKKQKPDPIFSDEKTKKEKAKSENPKKGKVILSPYEKLVESQMKLLKLTKEQAETQLVMMGILDPSKVTKV